jgi:putative drug exporter of the RND superfamily
MFTRLGHLTVRRRKLILVLTGLFVVLAGVLGAGVFDRLQTGGFDDPSSESSRAEDVLEEEFGRGDPNVVLLATAVDGDVDSPASSAAGLVLAEQLAEVAHVGSVASYWDLGSPPPLRNTDGDSALVLARVDGTDAEVEDALAAIEEDLTGEQAALSVDLGGRDAVFDEIGRTVESDLARAESIAIPITLILLVLVFGSLVAASLPLLVGGVAIIGTFLALTALAALTDVSIFSINLTTALGLGLAIDYSLFIVSRYREELHTGYDPHTAVVRTVERAGRTIAFSALTVAVSLSALLIFPLYFLRSFAYAGVAVVLVAALASTVALPALLAVLGHRVDAGRIFRRTPSPESSGFWHNMAMRVMRRPITVATVAVAFLVVLGLPFLGAVFGLPDDRVLPASADTRQVSDTLRNEFTGNEDEAFAVVIPDPTDAAAVTEYATTVSTVDGVARVDSLDGSFIDGQLVAPANASSERFEAAGGSWFSVVPDVEAVSPEGEKVVKEIRAIETPFERLVGGSAAQLVDTKASIIDRLPWAGLIIAVATFVLLFMMFGSLLVPAKALVLNLLSLTATFGAMVWIFQEGNGSGLLDFTPTGTLDTTTPILMFCIAFGLSMDYEVFLLSRIKEEHDRTGDNEQSIASGLEKTGRIVTAAAALLAVTFLAFATSGVSFIKLFGIGLTLAVLMDATVVRATLVPAFMRLAGEANWWAPKPLRRFHDRFGLKEVVDDEPADLVVDDVPPREREPVRV